MRILIVSHEASETGAPLSLLILLEMMKEKYPHFSFDIIIVKDGILHREFKRIGKIWLWNDSCLKQIKDKTIENGNNGYDLAYFNTVESAHVLNRLVDNGIITNQTFVISHIHELDGRIQEYGQEKIQILNSRSNAIITVSEAVKKNLVENHNFSTNKITVIPPFSRALSPTSSPFPKSAMLKNRKIILGCGPITLGKGVDVFIWTARELKKISDRKKSRFEFTFCWLGEDTHNLKAYFQKDLEHLELNDVVYFAGHVHDVYPYFKKCDLFYMCSRQDSFPLVCLESASLSKPVIYFEKAGGIGEFLGSSAGFPIEYINHVKAAQLMHELLDNPTEAVIRAQKAHAIWKKHFTPDKLFSKISTIINLAD